MLDISSSINHNIVLTHSGDIYVWDCGSGGRLGFDSTNNVLTPKHLETRWATINDTRFKKKP